MRRFLHCSDLRSELRCFQNRYTPRCEEFMPELELYVPTCNCGAFADPSDSQTKPEFGDPHVPVLVCRSAGVRIVLGSHDYSDVDAPDIQIERRPGGWAIFLH